MDHGWFRVFPVKKKTKVYTKELCIRKQQQQRKQQKQQKCSQLYRTSILQ